MTRRFGAAILAPLGERLTRDEARLFAQANPFGFIVFQRNLASPYQIRALTSDLRDAVGWNAPIFIDQEGGRVQRMRPPLARDWRPPLEDVARAVDNAARAMALRYTIIAAELRGYGIDGNCAPALDVARAETHPILRNRLLGDTTETVARIGRAVAEAHLAAGVLPVVKHMPGHGLGTVDSHLDLPRVTAPRDVLDAVDFAAFKALSDMPLGMSAHLVFAAIDPRPATISDRMIRLIRDEIGFDGFLMTDDISMEALSGTLADRAAAARAAGCDAVLHCNGDFAEMQRVVEAAGLLDAAAQARAEAALAARRDPAPVDIAACAAEFDTLTSAGA